MKTCNQFPGKKGGAKSVVTLFVLFMTFCTVSAQNARIQFIHASPYPESENIDVYINGERFINDISFMHASSYKPLPADETLRIDVTPAWAADNNTPLYSKEVQLLDGRPYILALIGDPLLRDDQPQMEIVLKIDAPEKKDPRSYYSFVDIVELMAIPDAGKTRSRMEGYSFFGQQSPSTLYEWLNYGEFSYELHSVPGGSFWTDQYLISRGPHARIVADYNELQGQGVVKTCSGFLNPPTPDYPGMTCRLFAADGSATDMQILTSRIQFINASAFKDAAKVDIWIDGYRWADDLAYTAGTAFLDVAPGIRSIFITRSDDNSDRFRIKYIKLPEDRTMAMIVHGDPKKSLGDSAMDLAITIDAREGSKPGEPVGLKVFNAIADVASLDLLVDTVVSDLSDPPPVVDPSAMFVEDLPYGAFTVDYVTYDNLEHIVTTRSSEKGVINLKRVDFGALPETMPGINVQSGFVNPVEGGTSSVIDFTVFPDGTTYTSDRVAGMIHFINGSAYPESQKVDIYAGSLKVADDLDFRSGTGFIPVFSGVRSLKVVPADATDNSEYWVERLLSVLDGRDYAIVVGGSPEKSSENSTMKLHMKYLGHQEAMQPMTAEILDINLIPDRPIINIEELAPETTLIAQLEYGSFGLDHAVFDVDQEEYLLACDYLLGGPTYSFDAADFEGESLIMLHAGFAEPEDGYPSYQATIIRSDGSSLTTMLKSVRSDTEIPTRFTLKGNYPNPFNPVTNIEFDLPEAAEVSLEVFDLLGRNVMNLSAQPMAAGFNQRIQLNASNLASGMYVYRLTATFDTIEITEAGQMVLVK